MRATLIVLVLAVVGALALAPVHRGGVETIEGQYIVVYHSNTTSEELDAELVRFTSVHAVATSFTYRTAIKGFAAALDARQLAAVRASPLVDFVEEDQVMRALQGCETQANVPTWGLNRISQRAIDLDDNYHYPSHQGSGVNVYVIDTGVYLAHNDFGGRAIFGFKANAAWSNNDANGHGTHVASTTAGTTFGVAKSASIIAVKVLGDNGSGTTAGVVAGVDWAAADYYSKARPGVANMSLGGGYSAALNNACDSASATGLIMSVAAGNDNQNACNYSPASADDVISVGSTDVGVSGGNQIDIRSPFSNWGTCTDVFAPGSNIMGAWIGTPAATRTISGTSMASPHICGITALIVAANPNLSFAQVKAEIVASSTKGVITLNCGSTACNQSPNALGYNGC